MCGRYVSVAERTDLIELYNATAAESSTAPASYNVAPTQNVTAVIERTALGDDGVQRSLRPLKWGLVPFWAKDPKIGSRMINARVETLAEKPAFRQAFAKRRTVLPANGYYEWAPEEIDGKIRKQPYYIHPAEDGVLSLAGLYELWADPSLDKDDPERWLRTVTIITTDATGPAGEIHDRTPLILPIQRVDAWLDPQLTHPDKVRALLTGIELDPLAVRRVSTTVNNVRTNGAQLLEPVGDEADQPLQLALA